MTVASSSNKITYQGNGSTTDFTFTFSTNGDESDILVYITDADGVITQLATNLYEVTLTAPTGTNPTGAGGSVEYPLSGSPLAAGNYITILRQLPFTQQTSLANQGTLWQPTIEASLDVLSMQIAQLNEQLGRQFTVPVSDDNPEEVPTAEERASQNAIWDSDGNLTAGLPVSSTVNVSSAMQPVVEAAMLALARTAMGLGAMAVEGIGAGLEDDGAGAVRVISIPVAVSSGQAVTAAFHQKEYHATGALTFTNPDASTLFDGFGYWVYALTGAITFVIDASDSFSGGSVGVSFIIPAGSRCYISTDGVSTWFTRVETINNNFANANFQISSSIASNNLTVEIKDRNGNDPSTNSPILIPFRDPTVASGNLSLLAITSALSIVAPNGASFGTSNNSAFRLWLVIFNDGGTPRLGLINCLSYSTTSQSIYPLGQVPVVSSTLLSAASTTAQVVYTQGGAVTTKAFVILGYLTWESGLAAAGSYSALPTYTEIYKPNTKLPGDVLQSLATSTGALTTTTNTYAISDTPPAPSGGINIVSQAITPTSLANLLELEGQALLGSSATAIETHTASITQDAGTTPLFTSSGRTEAANSCPTTLKVWGMIKAAASTFRLYGSGSGGTINVNGNSGSRAFGGTANSFISVKEIMA